MSSAVEDSLGIDSLQKKDINKEETKVYKLDNDVNDDQAPKEEKNISRVTMNIDNKLKASIEEPFYLELKILPYHLVYVFLEEESWLLVIITVGLAMD